MSKATTTTPESVAVEKPAHHKAVTLKDHLNGDAFRAAVAAALPKHLTPERFIRIATTAINKVPKLAECDQASFFSALMTLSQFGLEPDGRRAHLIPFANNKRGIVECQLIIDYKGLVELVMRSGVVSYLHADVVCDRDKFEFDKGALKTHVIDFKQPRGECYAVYALCRFKDGTEKCEVMTREEVEAIRKRSRSGSSGPWVTDWSEMAKKTVFRRLSKWLTLSPEFRDAVEADDDQLEERRFEAARPITVTPSAPALFAPATPAVAPAIEDDPEAPQVPDPAEVLMRKASSAGISEATLVAGLHSLGADESLSSVAEIAEMSPSIIASVLEDWEKISAGLKPKSSSKSPHN